MVANLRLSFVHFDRKINSQRKEGQGTNQAQDVVEEWEDHGHDNREDDVDCSPYQPEEAEGVVSVQWKLNDLFICDEAVVRPALRALPLNKLEYWLREDLHIPKAYVKIYVQRNFFFFSF